MHSHGMATNSQAATTIKEFNGIFRLRDEKRPSTGLVVTSYKSSAKERKAASLGYRPADSECKGSHVSAGLCNRVRHGKANPCDASLSEY